jgi:hypothetical protein
VDTSWVLISMMFDHRSILAGPAVVHNDRTLVQHVLLHIHHDEEHSTPQLRRACRSLGVRLLYVQVVACGVPCRVMVGQLPVSMVGALEIGPSEGVSGSGLCLFEPSITAKLPDGCASTCREKWASTHPRRKTFTLWGRIEKRRWQEHFCILIAPLGIACKGHLDHRGLQ